MLLSKDIQSNTKLPAFITFNSVFKERSSFSKVFDHIGLHNTEKLMSEVRPTLLQSLKNSAYGMRLNMGDHWIKNIGWGALGTPLLFTDFLIDRLYVHRLRQDFKEPDLKVVFSASEKEGAWDIATMSMRGISSCQSWHASQAQCLTGSIIDPCCGVIYITNGHKTKYGRTMLFRAVVRYIVHPKIGPCLFLERTYPVSKSSHILRAVNLLFASLLETQTKLPILYDYCLINDDSMHIAYIPDSQVIADNRHVSSYRDSNIDYYKIPNIDLKKYPSLQVIKEKYLTI